MDKSNKTLVIQITWWFWRNVAMTWAITELAKRRPVKVIASRPIAFWGNPYIKSVHGLNDPKLFETVIKWNDYFELEPYTDPAFFNDAENWLNVAARQLGLDTVPEPVVFLAEHEKIMYDLWCWRDCNRPKILFQPFGSSVNDPIGADKSYRSLYVKDAQYIANWLTQAWFEVYEVIRKWQPVLNNCIPIDSPDMRMVMWLCARYPVIWCDSCLHHCAKAFGNKAIVIRAWTDKERYWYDSNINMREFPMVAHTPMRLPMNDFDLDVSNQHTNQFSKGFLDKVIETAVKTFINNNNWLCQKSSPIELMSQTHQESETLSSTKQTENSDSKKSQK